MRTGMSASEDAQRDGTIGAGWNSGHGPCHDRLNRLRGRLGPVRYQTLVSAGGLRSFVESIGHFVVVEDHGRHVVQLKPTTQGLVAEARPGAG